MMSTSSCPVLSDNQHSSSRVPPSLEPCQDSIEGRLCILYNNSQYPFVHEHGIQTAASSEKPEQKTNKVAAQIANKTHQHLTTNTKSRLYRNKKRNPACDPNALQALNINVPKLAKSQTKQTDKTTAFKFHSTISDCENKGAETIVGTLVPAISSNLPQTKNNSGMRGLANAYMVPGHVLRGNKPRTSVSHSIGTSIAIESSIGLARIPESAPVFKTNKNLDSNKKFVVSKSTKKALVSSTSYSEDLESTSDRPLNEIKAEDADQPITANQSNWKKNPSMIASRHKLQEKYEQIKKWNCAEASLEPTTLLNDGIQPSTNANIFHDSINQKSKYAESRYVDKAFLGDCSSPMLSTFVPRPARYISTIDMSCVLYFYTDSGECQSLVLISHEDVVNFIQAAESEHKAELGSQKTGLSGPDVKEICHHFIQDKSCSTTGSVGCPHTHDIRQRQEIWKAMKEHMRTQLPNYDQVTKRFTSKVVTHDLTMDKMVTYIPLPENLELGVAKTSCQWVTKNQVGDCSTSPECLLPLDENQLEDQKITQLRSWARVNLSAQTRVRYLKTYLEQGSFPMVGEATSRLPAKCTRGKLFQPFPRLPAELRNIIWNYAIDSQPIDCLVRHGWNYEIDGEKHGNRLDHISCCNPFLYVNSESRSLTLPRHHLTFATRYHRPKILFDYERDRLFLVTENHIDLCFMIEKLFHRDDRRRVRNLMLPLRDYLQHWSDVCYAITSFSHVETVWFAIGDGKDEEPWSKHPHIGKKIGAHLQEMWMWRFRKQKPKLVPRTPKVVLNIIPAEVAHGLKIDGCRWMK